ncbi:MAG: ComEC/Rec2 family competence protein [bacterium]|nr:MAG: ComEC/Rec2 family competence protein [bacterium]
MVMWWAVFFVCGAFIPSGSLIRPVVPSIVSALLLSAFAYSRTQHSAIPPQKAIIFLTAVILWYHADMARESHRTAHSTLDSPAGHHIQVSDTLRELPVPERLRERIVRSLDNDSYIGRRNRQLLCALVLARRYDLDLTLRDSYNYLGIGHLLALSGLHLGIIAAPVGFLIASLRLRRWLTNTLLLTFLFLYTAVVGFPPSLIRAFILCAVVITHRTVGTKTTLLHSLVIGGLVIALIDFGVVTRAGFQLSFLAVCGIASIGLPLSRCLNAVLPGGRLGRAVRFILYPVIVTGAIQLFTLPLVLHLFKRASLLAPLVNLLVVLPVTAFLYLGIAYIVMPFEPVREILSHPLDLLSRLLWEVPTRMALIPHPACLAGEIDPIIHSTGIALLSVSLLRGTGKRSLVAGAACLCIVVSPAIRYVERVQSGHQLTGRASVQTIRTGRGGTACQVIRGDPVVLLVEEPLSAADAIGVVRTLWGYGIRTVDHLLLAHGSNGSLRGTKHLISRMRVGEILCSPYLIHRGGSAVFRTVRTTVPTVALSRGLIIRRGTYVIDVSAPVYPPSREAVPVDETAVGCTVYTQGGDGRLVEVLRTQVQQAGAGRTVHR